MVHGVMYRGSLVEKGVELSKFCIHLKICVTFDFWEIKMMETRLNQFLEQSEDEQDLVKLWTK